MSNHFGLVAFERSRYAAPEYDAYGKLTNPLGNERAGLITNAVCYAIQDEGWGLRLKPSGTNWNGRALDVLINKRLHVAVDCLGDAEGRGVPMWSEIKYEVWFDDEWVAPTKPGGEPTPPVPPEPPTPPIPPTPPVKPDERLVSANGKFNAVMQDDGNLVIYKSGVAIWASGSAQK